MTTRWRHALVAITTLAWLAGCAATAPAPATHPPKPGASSPSSPANPPVGSTASGGSISVHPASPDAPPAVPATVTDSTPSADALAVLGTIPEPLGGPPSENAVPVPAPTEALGEKSHSAGTPNVTTPPATPATPNRASSGGAAAGGAAASGAGVARAASPDSCWRVQVLAPPEQDRADRMSQAAQSQLGVPFVIEREGGLYKVRTRDCLSSNAATALKNRAIADGFDGSFRFLKAR